MVDDADARGVKAEAVKANARNLFRKRYNIWTQTLEHLDIRRLAPTCEVRRTVPLFSDSTCHKRFVTRVLASQYAYGYGPLGQRV